MDPAMPQQLPQSFRDFCAANNINEGIYRSDQNLPRYVRFKAPPSADIIAAVCEQLGAQLEPVRWLPGFFALPQNVKIAGSEAYKKGQIFGIDASSGAAVEALDVRPGDNVLDLCAAPGAKLCLISDHVSPSGTATGVDISPPRLAATRTLLRKYGAAHNCRLFLADGTTFSERPPTRHVLRQFSKQTGLEQGSEAKGRGIHLEGVDVSINEEGARRSCEVDEDRGFGFGEICTESAVEAQGQSRKSDGRIAIPNPKSGTDSLQTARECEISRSLDTAAVQLGKTPSPVQSLEGTALEERQPANVEACGTEIGPTEGSESLDISEKRSEREGESRKKERRRRRPIGGSETKAQLFFFGRGITPRVLETAEGSGRAKLYDKVLVDAECTHDGSLKHIRKYDWWGWDTFERRVMDPDRLAALTDLQGRLLSNGFRLLKPGGSLVYSTCSFTRAQNEDVVSTFLDAHPDADVVAIPQAATWPCSPGTLQHTLRFTPDVSKTGGLFIAKIMRKQEFRS
ncbi:hypothetical protein KFL_002680160 [Klebsormidium nitens]|uniref:SAM-dependent MTase RsmB/NOP-type domain-containing protein n=1 Tax=Klebsormidium nitens TaxID=105231 RepID=A0A1Y1I544_KLENI|nr:hypothetical protein KFL_002680160 [Klebsormidium nitens]|eukprot:GAQ86070.1 hypothetical protein KFL_002680160 [Klebsormidium nitens]